MYNFQRGRSPDLLIALCNQNSKQGQPQQFFNVCTNTTVLDLMNHLKKLHQNKEIELFIQPNQLYQGTFDSLLSPLLPLGNKTIYYKVIGEEVQLYEQLYVQKKPGELRNNSYSGNLLPETLKKKQKVQQNQNQINYNFLFTKNSLGENVFESQPQASQQQILKLNQEIMHLQTQINREKEENKNLQKQIQSQRQSYQDQIKQLIGKNKIREELLEQQQQFKNETQQWNSQLEKEIKEKDALILQVNELKQNQSQQEAYIQEMTQNFEQERKEMETRIQELTQQLKQFEQVNLENSQLLENIKLLKTDVKKFSNGLDEQKKENFELQKQIKFIDDLKEENKELATLLTENEQLKQRISILNLKNKASKEQLKALINDYSQLKTEKRQMENIKNKQQVLKEESIYLEKKMHDVQQRYEQLQQSQQQQNSFFLILLNR